jgi:hypothetical protein
LVMSNLTWSRGFSYGFLWIVSIIQLLKELESPSVYWVQYIHIRNNLFHMTQGGYSVKPLPEQFLVFKCAVALCTMQNAFLVISNLTWPK